MSREDACGAKSRTGYAAHIMEQHTVERAMRRQGDLYRGATQLQATEDNGSRGRWGDTAAASTPQRRPRANLETEAGDSHEVVLRCSRISDFRLTLLMPQTAPAAQRSRLPPSFSCSTRGGRHIGRNLRLVGGDIPIRRGGCIRSATQKVHRSVLNDSRCARDQEGGRAGSRPQAWLVCSRAVGYRLRRQVPRLGGHDGARREGGTRRLQGLQESGSSSVQPGQARRPGGSAGSAR